jgi:hypothetical protein
MANASFIVFVLEMCQSLCLFSSSTHISCIFCCNGVCVVMVYCKCVWMCVCMCMCAIDIVCAYMHVLHNVCVCVHVRIMCACIRVCLCACVCVLSCCIRAIIIMYILWLFMAVCLQYYVKFYDIICHRTQWLCIKYKQRWSHACIVEVIKWR